MTSELNFYHLGRIRPITCLVDEAHQYEIFVDPKLGQNCLRLHARSLAGLWLAIFFTITNGLPHWTVPSEVVRTHTTGIMFQFPAFELEVLSEFKTIYETAEPFTDTITSNCYIAPFDSRNSDAVVGVLDHNCPLRAR